MLVKMWIKGNSSALLVGMQIDAATMENSVKIPQKIKNRTIIWSSNPTSKYIFKIIESRTWRNICMPVFIMHYSQWPRDGSSPNVHWQMDGWTYKLWYIHAIEYYSVLKRKEIFSHGKTQMNLSAEWNKPVTGRQILYDSSYGGRLT